jgi:hypothetical protein
MPHTVANGTVPAHLERVQNSLRPMAKADLKKVQKAGMWAKDGQAIAVCIALTRHSDEPRLPYTRKEAAGAVGAEENQLAAWIAAAERPQTERFENHPVFAAAMAVAKALQRPDVFEVCWTITAKVQP